MTKDEGFLFQFNGKYLGLPLDDMPPISVTNRRVIVGENIVPLKGASNVELKVRKKPIVFTQKPPGKNTWIALGVCMLASLVPGLMALAIPCALIIGFCLVVNYWLLLLSNSKWNTEWARISLVKNGQRIVCCEVSLGKPIESFRTKTTEIRQAGQRGHAARLTLAKEIVEAIERAIQMQ